MIDINDYLAMVNLAMAMVQRLDQTEVDGLTTFL